MSVIHALISSVYFVYVIEMGDMEMGDGPMEMMEDVMEDGRMMMPGMGGSEIFFIY